MFRIGIYHCEKPTVLAPMAGVTDLAFRRLCRRYGAGLTVSEMVTADSSLWHTNKSRLRLPHRDEPAPRMIQIAGGDPLMLAEAACKNVEMGAQIIDINMGCPAKKVCKKAAGSALLQDEQLVTNILRTVVAAVDVPVTVKIRTGPSPDRRNATTIARIAEDAGIQAITVHGRTRACKFEGHAEYDTMAAVVDAVTIPVIANGDIDSPQKARDVLDHTGAAAVMIGRAAQGRPWIFREINHYLHTGELLHPPAIDEVATTLIEHVTSLHRLYGDHTGPRIARKHVGWYLNDQPGGRLWCREFNRLTLGEHQLDALHRYFDHKKNSQDEAA